MTEFHAKEIINFLSEVPPFQFLQKDDLAELTNQIKVEFYPKHTTILKQGGEPSKFLRIIKQGSVKVFITTMDGNEVITDYRGVGELIGYLSLMSGDVARATVVTLQDTICLLIPKEDFLRLLEKNSHFRDCFNKNFLKKYIDKTVKTHEDQGLMNLGSDKLLFTTTVGELATKGVISAFQDNTTIKEAAEIMSIHKISCLVIIDNDAVPVGIVTDKDLREKVVAKGKDVNENIGSIMSLTLIKIDAKEYCFEAVLKMIRHNIHHLLVVDDGKLKGIITNHDLLTLQSISPLNIAKDIEHQISIEGLVPISKKTNTIINLMLKEGVKAYAITKIITELNDRLVKKILSLTEKRLGKPPISYCWIVFGSEGRREQTFKTDQDNAIIYEDYDPQLKPVVDKYFEAFTQFVKESLQKCGFPTCPAGYMASNPMWRQPLSKWKKMFNQWIMNPYPESLIKSLIFFDFRPLYGDFNLANDLKENLFKNIPNHKLFLGSVANMAIKNKPPIGFFRSFVLEKEGEHKDQLNLKIKGTTLIVDMVRLFAFERGVKEPSTYERIEALRGLHGLMKDYADELQHGFDFLMLLRIQNQLAKIKEGRAPDNFIKLDNLTNLQKRLLKQTFNLISNLQVYIID
ncbi:MAG: DUF294 nucleotidyltransferase-like domain-containing protein, partial [Thermodesulfovibrionales bacterium]|nr:DUF294 nucleotidyltransferase-like domain-containing protein [Thermodesulfovibrionales bacterium]